MIFPRPSRRNRPYDVEDTGPPPPALPGHVVVAADADRLLDMLAAELIVQAKACVRRFGDFELALSGGSTPQPLYERLMYDPDARQIPWPRTHLWQVDERGVGPADERSNFRLIKETIVDHSGIPADQVHPMDGLSEIGDRDYEKQLLDVLQWRERGEDVLDFVLLGMGADGHTASLFPGNEVLQERERLVARVQAAGADPPERITLTYPAINAARFVAILVTGEEKAPAIRRITASSETAETLPVIGVRPTHGELKWFLDAAAAGEA
jgi:6-phosphogluconolactonase